MPTQSASLQIYYKKKHDPKEVERRRAYGRKYYQENKEKMKQKSRENKAYALAYYHEKRKHSPDYKAWRRQYARAYYHRNREKLNEARRQREQAAAPKQTHVVPLEERENPFLLAL